MQRGGKRRRSGNRRKPSSNFISSGRPWQDHIKETMRKNPDMKFGRALLKLASRTYNKGPSSARSSTRSSTRSSARSSARSSTARSSASPPGAVNLRTSNYSVRVRPNKSRTKRKTKRPKRPKRTKKSTTFLGF
jgi:hypothetical protein